MAEKKDTLEQYVFPRRSFRLSEKRKYEKKKEEAVAYMKSIIPGEFDLVSDDVKDNYLLYQNIIDKEYLSSICNQLKVGDLINDSNELLIYNKIPNKINSILSEIIRTSIDTYRALVIGDRANLKKQEELRAVISHLVQQQLDSVVEIAQAKLNNTSEEELQAIYEKYQSQLRPEDFDIGNFRAEEEILTEKIIQFGELSNNLKLKKVEGFKHTLLSDTQVVKVFVENGKPKVENINPLNFFFSKGQDEMFIQDGDYAGCVDYITARKCLEIYGDSMSKAERDKIIQRFSGGAISYNPNDGGIHYGSWESGSKFNHPASKITNEEWFGLENEAEENSMYATSNEGIGGQNYSNSELIERVNVEWKWERKIGILTWEDEWGNEQLEFVDEGFPIPDNVSINKDYVNDYGSTTTQYFWEDEETQVIYSLHWIWLPFVWEGIRLDGDIYVNVREREFQYLSIDNPFNNKLSYHGLVFSGTNAASLAPVSRAKPFQYLYFVSMNQLQQLISRNKGVVIAQDIDQLPTLPGFDEEDKALAHLYFLSKGLNYYSSMANSEGELRGMPPNRGNATQAQDLSNLRDILNLTQVIDWLERQIGDDLGVPKIMEGQMQYEQVGNNKMAQENSSNVGLYYKFLHAELWKTVMETYCVLFKKWARKKLLLSGRKEMTFQYMLPDSSIATLMVESDKLNNMSDTAIWLVNSIDSKIYMDKMESLLLPIVQNGMEGLEEISYILKARSEGVSPEEVHKMLKQFNDDRKARNEQAQNSQYEQQSALQQEQMQMMQQTEQAKHDREKELIMLKGQIDMEIQKFIHGIKMVGENIAYERDRDRDGMDDSLEPIKLQHQINVDNKTLELKERELNIKARQSSK